MGVDKMQYGLTTYIDGVESWTQFGTIYDTTNSSAQGINVQLSGVNEACEITELYKFYSSSASAVFEEGTSYQLYIPLEKYIAQGWSTKWTPMQALFSPQCVVRAYLAPNVYTDFDAVLVDQVSSDNPVIMYLTVSVPKLDQSYYALEVRLHHSASGCYINSETLLASAIHDSVNLNYLTYNLYNHTPAYRILSQSEQEDIFTPPVDDPNVPSGGGIDLTETNSLIGKIKEGIQSVIDSIVALPGKIWDTFSTGLHDLFIPSSEAITVFKDDMLAIFADHFGALYDCVDILEDYVSQMNVTTVTETITFPEVTLDLGEPFTFGGWTVDVVPDGFGFLFDSLKWLIDAICTLAFINTMRERFDDLMVGGDQDVD